jgi:hypothetical protein
VWERTIEARRASAQAFVSAGEPGEEAIEHLTAAGRLTVALQLTSGMDAVREAARLARHAQRIDLQARALGLEGNVLATQGGFDKGRKAVLDRLNCRSRTEVVRKAGELGLLD